MDYTREEVLKYIEEEDAKFIRLAFRDAFGLQKNISVMPTELNKAFDCGIPINAREIAGFHNGSCQNLYLKPDPTTLSVLPWRSESGQVLRMFCDLYTADGKEYEADTRYILEQAVKAAKEAGVQFRFGSETEFYLFTKDENGNATKNPYDEAGYMDIAPLDRCENVRREICLTIERMGLRPERSHHEQGPGQNEIDFHYGKPVQAADQMTTFKMVVNTVADRYGLTADFSPMPLPGKPGNGYHINIYAKDKDGNDVAKYAAAGIMARIRDITLFLNPTVDSYNRLGKNTAPDKVNWSSLAESELMYIDTYEKRTRAELRSPDASSNPYLVYALLIHAGLEGILNKMELPEERGENSLLLPETHNEAGRLALESDFVKNIVPEELIKEYVGK